MDVARGKDCGKDCGKDSSDYCGTLVRIIRSIDDNQIIEPFLYNKFSHEKVETPRVRQ